MMSGLSKKILWILFFICVGIFIGMDISSDGSAPVLQQQPASYEQLYGQPDEQQVIQQPVNTGQIIEEIPLVTLDSITQPTLDPVETPLYYEQLQAEQMEGGPLVDEIADHTGDILQKTVQKGVEAFIYVFEQIAD
ncbi:hypothetical protein [Longirhabdus pacifica]|uniref:hypothetical protein n=1 Tax=Longirhabdus pacifica TaxID=2305227 RepID=UPI001008981A|nr:hypothetical protein [Longirhabdus pacifica]